MKSKTNSVSVVVGNFPASHIELVHFKVPPLSLHLDNSSSWQPLIRSDLCAGKTHFRCLLSMPPYALLVTIISKLVCNRKGSLSWSLLHFSLRACIPLYSVYYYYMAISVCSQTFALVDSTAILLPCIAFQLDIVSHLKCVTVVFCPFVLLVVVVVTIFMLPSWPSHSWK